MHNIQHKRGLRAAFDALVLAGSLIVGQIYYIEDEGWAVIATGNNTYTSLSGPYIKELGGQILHDPGEVNGYGPLGVIDSIHTQDWGDVTALNAGTLNPISLGGFSFPFDVRLKRFYCVWDSNSTAAELITGHGWVILQQTRLAVPNSLVGDDGRTTAVMLNQCDPFVYPEGITQTRIADITTFTNDVVPAGSQIALGIGAADDTTTVQKYSRIHTGHLEFERV